MRELSIHKQMETKIRKLKRGTIIFPGDFAEIADGQLAKKVLDRLKRKGIVSRLAFGIYLYPKRSKLLGELTPSIEQIALAIAKRDRARIVPTGAFALNALGLSTQVPLNAVYLTDGAPRKIKVGKRSILLKKSTPKNLMAIGPVSSLVIQALKAIGNGRVDPSEERTILKLLRNEKRKNIQHDLLIAPEWVRKIMKKSILQK
jgi:Family of unknown function (DUF6088)